MIVHIRLSTERDTGMGMLGKDLFDIKRPRRNTKVEFGESYYWVESNPAPQPYGTILTEILNLDAAPYQAVMDKLDDVVKHKNSKEAPRLCKYTCFARDSFLWPFFFSNPTPLKMESRNHA